MRTLFLFLLGLQLFFNSIELQSAPYIPRKQKAPTKITRERLIGVWLMQDDTTPESIVSFGADGTYLEVRGATVPSPDNYAANAGFWELAKDGKTLIVIHDYFWSDSSYELDRYTITLDPVSLRGTQQKLGDKWFYPYHLKEKLQ